MIPREIKTDHVRTAIAQIDSAGVPRGRNSRKYSVKFHDRRYPPKYVLSLAALHALGRELLPEEFNGGIEANSFLQRLGFEIEGATSRRVGEVVVSSEDAIQVADKHGNRCQGCKRAVLAMLSALYGGVEERHTFHIAPTLEGFNASAYLPELTAIYTALRNERGFDNFVRCDSMPPCDFFVTQSGFIVEFDESQHFTRLRERALAQYPPHFPVGFDRNEWIRLCRTIDAHDNDPVFRDEQRAWYDTLRDFVPSVFGLRSTVRLFESEYRWCGRNPASEADVETFRQILSDRAHFWTINVEDKSKPKFGRIVFDGAWAGDSNSARSLLFDVAVALPVIPTLKCLSTCGAFLRFDWPQELEYIGDLNPDTNRLAVLTGAAEATVRNVFTQDLVERLKSKCDYVTIGIDTKKRKVSTTYNIINEPHAELVCLIDLHEGTFHWTGKFYPTPQQEPTILRYPDIQSHFVTLGADRVMILGCHDLSVYSARGQAAAGPWRRQIAADFRSLAKHERPVAVLHHPHTTVKPGTWRQQWRSLELELPTVSDYLGTAAYSIKDDGWQNRHGLPNVLKATQRGDVLNVVVRLAADDIAIRVPAE
jgi:hypothetical protein